MAIIVIPPAVTCKSYVAFVSGQALLYYAYRSENHLQLFFKKKTKYLLHCITSQKTVIFVLTATKTSKSLTNLNA